MVGTMRDESHVSDLLPGYCLGCLEPAEAARVEEHLDGCASCRGELARLEEVAGSLALALPEAQPRTSLEDELMRKIGAAGTATAGPSLRQLPRRHPQPARARGSFLGSPVAGIAAAVLVLVLAAGNVAQYVRGRAAPARAAATAPAATGLTTIVLVGVNTGQGAYGTVVLDMADNGGVLAMRGLPRLDAAHQYQLWLVRNGERRSGGVFSVDEDGYGNLLLTIPKDFRGFTTLGISIEPAGGSPAPTGARVAAGSI
jgi:anti-sigma-K factor RskA